MKNSQKNIDLSTLRTSCKDNTAVMAKIIKLVLDKAPQQIETLQQAHEIKDQHEVKMIAHKLKSSFRTVGAEGIALSLEKMELKTMELKSSYPPEVDALLSDFVANIDSVYDELMMELEHFEKK